MPTTSKIDLTDVQLAGGDLHGEHIARTYGFTIAKTLISPYRYKIGGFDLKATRKYFEDGKLNVLHWIGTDVQLALKRREMRWAWMDNVIHWCVAPNLQEELREIGIHADIVLHKPKYYFDEPLPPGGDGIVTYIPPNRPEYFFEELMLQVRDAIPDREFIILPKQDLRNRRKHSLMYVFEGCSHYLRFVEHDGFSHFAAEMILAGRSVITNQHRPFQTYCEPKLEAIVEHIHNAEPHPQAPMRYREICDARHVTNRWKALMDEHASV